MTIPPSFQNELENIKFVKTEIQEWDKSTFVAYVTIVHSPEQVKDAHLKLHQVERGANHIMEAYICGSNTETGYCCSTFGW